MTARPQAVVTRGTTRTGLGRSRAGWLGAAIVAVVVWRLGTGPFLDGLRAVDGRSLALAAGIGFVTTVCAAWRWNLVARGLGVALPLRTATAAYYRSQFLNTVLPGGVLGDVDRAVRHGSEAGNVGRGLRAVAWERSAGQVVQLVLGLVVLLLLPSWVPTWVPLMVAAAVVGVLGGGLLLRGRPPRGASRGARALRAAAGDIRDGLTARRAWPGIALASVVVVAGHLATLVLAARTAGAITPIRPVAAAGHAGAAGDGGADQHRRLGSPRGHGRLGVRRRRPRRRPGRRDDHRVRRPLARGHLAGCSAARRRLAPAPPLSAARCFGHHVP